MPRQRRNTVVKSSDLLSGFTFSPRRVRRDAQQYDMRDGNLRRSRPRTPRRRRKTKVKSPESDPLEFDEGMFSPRNTRREGMYVGLKKKKPTKKKKKATKKKKKGSKTRRRRISSK